MNRTIFWGTADPDVPALFLGYKYYHGIQIPQYTDT